MLRFIILSVSTLTLVSNYFTFNSYRYQTILLNDAKNDKFTLSISELNNINYKYPSLALNSVPILTYISRYYTEENQFNYAIDQLKQSLVFNPNSLYTKYLLSRNYIFLNDFKSAEIYLEQIFDQSPKIESSSSLYLSVLEINQNINDLVNIYDNMIEVKSKIVWQYYLSALKNNLESDSIKLVYSKSLMFFKKNY